MDRALYDEHAELEQDHWWFVGRRAVIRAVLAAQRPPGGAVRILDVGCGTGGMLPMLAEVGGVSGIEAEPLAVELCHRNFGRFDVQLGRIPDDIPRDGSYDLVTAFDVIEHLADDLEAVVTMAEATRAGGSVLVTVPAHQWLWSAHDERNGHHRRYDAAGLRRVLEAAGLVVDHLTYFNTLLLPAVVASRLAERLRRDTSPPTSDFTMPSPLVNRLLTRTFGAERHWVSRHRSPTGVSLIAMTHRPA